MPLFDDNQTFDQEPASSEPDYGLAVSTCLEFAEREG